jgi:hypothetical protein
MDEQLGPVEQRAMITGVGTAKINLYDVIQKYVKKINRVS